MDHEEPSLVQTRATYLLEVYSRSLRDGYFKCSTWTAVTCIFFDCNFLKKSLFGVACKAREHAILNYKNDNFCTFFSLYKNTDMRDACCTI